MLQRDERRKDEGEDFAEMLRVNLYGAFEWQTYRRALFTLCA